MLLVFAVPLILSNLFQQLYNMIDSLIVGNYLGADALAAVGSAGTITAVMVQMASGLALGASVVIAQYFGAGKKEKIRLCMTTICFFSVVVGVLVTVVTQVFATEILKIVKTPDGIMDESVKYLTIYFWGSVAIFLYNALQAVYIAMGDSKTPLYFLMVAFVLNVVGDLYFIVRWNLGVSGGALATTLSQLLCMVLSLVVLEGKMRRMGMERNQKIFDKTEFGRMMRIALPAALQQSVVSLGNVCVQMVTNSFGAAAGCAAANKGVNLVSVVPMNWGNALSNYVSQNVGAKKTERISQGVQVSLLMTGGLSLLMVLLMERIPEEMIGWFVEGEGAGEVIEVGASYLRVVGWSLPRVFRVYGDKVGV